MFERNTPAAGIGKKLGSRAYKKKWEHHERMLTLPWGLWPLFQHIQVNSAAVQLHARSLLTICTCCFLSGIWFSPCPASHVRSYCYGCYTCTLSRDTSRSQHHKYGGQHQPSPVFQRISCQKEVGWVGSTNLSLQAGVGTRRFNLQREQTETAITLKSWKRRFSELLFI